MKSKLFLAVFVAAGGAWATIVTVFAAQNGFAMVPYLNAPWAGIALGTFGGWLIGAFGLRMYNKIAHAEALRKINARPRLAAVSGNDPLVPCQVGYREPYFNSRG